MNNENKQRAVLKVFGSDEEAERDRLLATARRTPQERFDLLMKLMKIAFTLNNGKPFKKPDGKYVIHLKKQRSNGPV